MYKVLRIGDPHVTVANLEESKKLMDFIILTAKEKQVNWIEFLGDLFHTHAVVRSEVLAFWKETFQQLAKEQIETRVLVGNHDQIGDKEREYIHALVPFQNYPYIKICDKLLVFGPFMYCAYTSDEREFLKRTDSKVWGDEGKVLICHQTFQGCSFENGFYAEDGFDISLVSQKTVISGHIHKTQQIGKCFYPGTAKWDKATDAGSDKGIWYFEHDKEGSILSKEFISTKNVVTPIFKYIINEGDEEIDIPEGTRSAIELRGQSSWISKMKKKYKGKGSIRAIPLDRKFAKADNSKLPSLDDYINSFLTITDTTISKEEIIGYIRGLNESSV